MEVPVFVARDRIQRLAFEQLAGFSEAVEESFIKVVPQDSIQQRTSEQFADFPEVVKESFFLFLSQDESQQREKCIEMLEQPTNVPKTGLQDEVQRWYAEQSAEFPASPDMKGPVCTARRCGAGGGLSCRITCRRGAGRSLILWVACRRDDAGRSLSSSVGVVWAGD